MAEVTVRGDDIEGAIRRFRKGYESVVRELRLHSYAMTRSQRRKTKDGLARIRRLKKERWEKWLTRHEER